MQSTGWELCLGPQAKNQACPGSLVPACWGRHSCGGWWGGWTHSKSAKYITVWQLTSRSCSILPG
ncbi:unnamed protein product [Nyctereutes procyonoides]|uniref:(raccoon dog) hypothetical protein n=1 Tax=Nyctereutes procyonoides TaxID=34880 RepID=A0A811ZZJ6_NYCPR|nr:unnamed protein product [Nyctereutes procyonoides]